MRHLLIALLLGTVLAGCVDDPDNAGPAMQDHVLAHAQKTQAPIQVSNYQDVVEGLYISYFDRPADPAGLINYERALADADAPTDIRQLSAAAAANPAIEALVASFAGSAESQKL